MTFHEGGGCVQLAMDAGRRRRVRRCPPQLKWFEMKSSMMLWIGDLGLDDFDDGSMVKIAQVKVFHTWMLGSTMERHGYLDRLLCQPASISIHSGSRSSSKGFAPNSASIWRQDVFATSCGLNSELPTMDIKSRKLSFDFCAPCSQYQRPSR